jgi:hypothetical protein
MELSVVKVGELRLVIYNGSMLLAACPPFYLRTRESVFGIFGAFFGYQTIGEI